MFDFEDYYKIYNGEYMSLYLQQKQLLQELCENTTPEPEKKKRQKRRPSALSRFISDEASFLLMLIRFESHSDEDYYASASLSELSKDNAALMDGFSKAYSGSCLNPAFSGKIFGRELGEALSVLAAIIRENAAYAKAHMRFAMTFAQGLFLEFVQLCSGNERISAQEVLDLIARERGEHASILLELELYKQYVFEGNHNESLILEGDLSDEGLLYREPAAITEDDRALFAWVNSLPQEQIDSWAEEIVDRYRQALLQDGKDYLFRRSVGLIHRAGMERLTRRVMTIMTEHTRFVPYLRGWTSSVRAQAFERDHRNDAACYLTEEASVQMLAIYGEALERHKDCIALCSGILDLSFYDDPEPFVQGDPAEEEESVLDRLLEQKGALLNAVLPGPETYCRIPGVICKGQWTAGGPERPEEKEPAENTISTEQ